jgi:hypothetical protein
MVILFLRGFASFADEALTVSPSPAPPSDRALLRDFVFAEEAISLRNGDGWIGAFSPRRRADSGVAALAVPASEALLARGDRRTFGGDISCSLSRALSAVRW